MILDADDIEPTIVNHFLKELSPIYTYIYSIVHVNTQNTRYFLDCLKSITRMQRSRVSLSQFVLCSLKKVSYIDKY